MLPGHLGLPKPAPLDVDHLLIQHALDLIRLDEAGQLLLDADEFARLGAATGLRGRVERVRCLPGAIVELVEVIRTAGMAGRHREQRSDSCRHRTDRDVTLARRMMAPRRPSLTHT